MDANAKPAPPPKLDRTPFERIGDEATVRAIVERFYDAMERVEPDLAALHEREEIDGALRVSRRARDRFALFLIGWLGGPQTYMERHGHPRLRMRHGQVPVDARMRDAWTRSMGIALDEAGVSGDVRAFLDAKFADLADFLRNRPG